MRADLHTHTYLSDGTLSPQALIEQAAMAGLQILSITDHDTFSCTSEVQQWARRHAVTLVPGIEFSTINSGIPIHVLAYFVGPSMPSMQELLKKSAAAREQRNLKMLEKFREEGISLDWSELKALADGDVITRPHFAKLLVEKNYVRNLKEAFYVYLADYARCYVPREEIPSREVLEAVRACGGISALAHPAVYGLKNEPDYKAFLEPLVQEGLSALEVYYSKHSLQDTEFFLRLAKHFNLLPLGGSDFHGENKKDVLLGKFSGSEAVFQNIQEALQKRSNHHE